jgi:esterase/lipase superfamily enzyme
MKPNYADDISGRPWSADIGFPRALWLSLLLMLSGIAGCGESSSSSKAGARLTQPNTATAANSSQHVTACEPLDPARPTSTASVAGSASPESPADPEKTAAAAAAEAEKGTAATPWTTTSRGVPKEFAVVTVFYGTDRAAASALEVGRHKHWVWYQYTAGLGAVTIVVAVAAIRRPGRWWLRSLTCLGTLATLGLGIATAIVRLNAEKAEENAIAYTGARGTMQVGTCEVRVPRYHEPNGTSRASIFRLEFRTDPRLKVALADVEPAEKSEFFAKVRAQVEKSARKEAMVFVHGFNVTFEAAAQRTAQLVYDLKFEGAPIFFSWPSQGGLLKYAVDETNVAWATPHLRQFLAEIVERCGAEKLHVIAHSMGNRAVTAALASLAFEMRDRQPMFDQVVLTAPDVDADLFRDDLAPALARTARQVTLYASSNDEVLELSQRVHGYPRAGDSWPDLVVVSGIDTIDVSEVDSSLLGHSYYGDNETVLTDLFYLIHEGRPPEKRDWLEPCEWFELEPFWMFSRPSRTAAQPPKPDRR